MQETRKTNSYDLTITMDGKPLLAHCTEMIGFAKSPMIRVALNHKKNKTKVFIFYRVKNQELFWFDLPKSEHQKIANKLAKQLLNT